MKKDNYSSVTLTTEFLVAELGNKELEYAFTNYPP